MYAHEQRPQPAPKGFSPSFPPRDGYDEFPRTTSSLWLEYFSTRRLDADLASVNGWYLSLAAGDSHPRIVIPCSASQPNNRYWQARAIEPRVEPRYQSPHGVARGDAVVLVWPSPPRRSPSACGNGSAIVEGPFDALAAAEVGLVGIALMGNAPSEEVMDRAVQFALPPVIVVSDLDAVTAAVAIMKKVYARGRAAYLVSTYPNKDLAATPKDIRGRLLGL